MCVYEIYLLIFKFEFLVTFANRISAVGLVARAISVISTLYSYNYMLRNRRKTIILLDLNDSVWTVVYVYTFNYPRYWASIDKTLRVCHRWRVRISIYYNASIVRISCTGFAFDNGRSSLVYNDDFTCPLVMRRVLNGNCFQASDAGFKNCCCSIIKSTIGHNRSI